MKKLIFIITLFIITLSNVYAKVYPYEDNLHIYASYYGSTATTQTISLANGSNTSTIEIYNDNPSKYESYLFFHVMVCRHGNDLYVSTTPYSTSGKIVNGVVYNSTDDCNDGYAGKISYIQYQISQWGTNDSWQTAFANGYSTIQGQNYVYVIAKYYSDEDIVTQLIENNMTTDILRQQINQSITNTQNIINSQNAINNSINDDSLPSTTGWLDSWTNLLLENNNINQLLYIPVNILTKIRTGLSGNCQNVTIPFGITGGDETLTFKCWKVTDYVGNTVSDLITGFVGFYLIYYFALFLWKFYDYFTSMRDSLALIMGNEDTLVVRGDQ